MLISLLIYFSVSYNFDDPDSFNGCSKDDTSLYDNLCSELEEGNTKNIIDNKEGNLQLGGTNLYRCCRQGIAGDITISVDIPNEAFYGSTKIKNVELTKEVTSIGNAAFYGCTNLVLSLDFKKELNAIGESAFEGCISLGGDISFSGSSIEKCAFKDCYQLTGTLTLDPRSDVNTQSILESAFESIPISGFVTGNKISTIGPRAFYSTNIKSDLEFTKTLTQIGKEAFKNTPITKITFAETDQSFQILDSAFENTYNIKQTENIVIPDTCTNLAAYAFARSSFSGTVVLGDIIRKISKYLFYNSSITRVTIPKGPTGNSFHPKLSEIQDHAFDNSHLTGTVLLGDYITKIGTFAFKSTLISGTIDLPDSLSDIGNFAFYNCTQINGPITLQDSLLSVGDYAFAKTAISGPITIKEGLTVGKGAFAETSLEDLTIYNTIAESTFEGIQTLKRVHIDYSSEKVTDKAIPKKAFKDCSISSIMEFDSVTVSTDAFLNAEFKNENSGATLYFKDSTINAYAFRSFSISKCLIDLTDTTPNSHAFETMKGTPRVAFNHVFIVDQGEDGESTTTVNIGEYAFYNTGIQGNLDIPYFIENVYSYSFAYCTGLTGYLNINATNIYNHAFYSCKFAGALSLGSQVSHLNYEKKEGQIPPAIEADECLTFKGCQFTSLNLKNKGTIPKKAFYQMTSINSPLIIPETVTNIGQEAFAGSKITSLTFESNPNPDQTLGANKLTIGKAAFMGCTEIKNDLVINRALDNSKIGDYAFYGCNQIKSLSFDTKLTTIGEHAFYQCEGLSSVSFPIEISSIGPNAFANCIGLDCNLVLHEATYVGDGAFQNCAGLKGALDLSNVVYIGGGAFSGCTGFDENLTLYNPTFPETFPNDDPEEPKLPYIGDSAFYGCRNLKGSLHLTQFETIGKRAFYECSGLNGQLYYPGLDVEDYAFYGCSGLNGPLTLKSNNINKYAFYGCSGFSGLFILPEKINSIGEYAFSGCSGLTGPLEFPSTITLIGKGAFTGCKGFSDHLSIQVGQSSSTPSTSNILRIDERAFEDCSGFKNGDLSIYIENDEHVDQDSSVFNAHYRYPYFLRIQNKAFDGTKFKNIYYNGRFQPDCDYDIGISSIKGIHTSSNYVNKTFCGNPVHKSKLSGGAIAGIVIACIVVVAAIVALIVYFIIRNKKNKDNSEGEVEMNNEP